MLCQLRGLMHMALCAVLFYIILSYSISYSFVKYVVLVTASLGVADVFYKMVCKSLFGSLVHNLKDQAVFITGCDTGFGHEFAKKLDSRGVTVFAGCLFAEGAGALKLKQECSDKLHIVQIDVTNEDQVREAFHTIKKTLNGKHLNSIVNNAGVLHVGEVETLPFEKYQKIMNVNAFGVVRVTNCFLPLLRESKGRVVMVVSIAGRSSFPNLSAYNMSKHAAMAYADTLRREVLSSSISVHTIEPIIYITPMSNFEVVTKSIEEDYNKLPAEIRAHYGENYMEKMKLCFKATYMLCSQPASKIHEVVQCMEDAAVGESPKLTYYPGLYGRFLSLLVCRILPDELTDFLSYAILTIPVYFSKYNKKD